MELKLPLLKNGRQGAMVAQAQTLLNLKAGFLAGSKQLDVDGNYGPATEDAVRQWQKARNLSVDGILGPDSWYSLIQDDPIPPK